MKKSKQKLLKHRVILSVWALAGIFFVFIVGFSLFVSQQKQSQYPALSQACAGSVLNGRCYETTMDRLTTLTQQAIANQDPFVCEQIDFGQDLGIFQTDPSLNQKQCAIEYLVAAQQLESCLDRAQDDYINRCVIGIAVLKRDPKICLGVVNGKGSECRQKVANKNYVRELFED